MPATSAASPWDRLLSRLAGRRAHAYWRSALIIGLVAWAPRELAVAFQQGRTGGFSTSIEFSAFARFLIALPAAILAQPFVDYRLAVAIRKLQAMSIVDSRDLSRCRHAIAAWRRRRASGLVDVVLAVLAYVVVTASPQYEIVQFTGGIGRTSTTSTPIFWEVNVSLPLLMFVLLRWLYRVADWSIFLFDFARLRLHLQAPHPDRAGGLGVLPLAHASFGAVAFAFSTAWSAGWYDRLTIGRVSLESLRIGFGIYIVMLCILFVAPLGVFTRKLNWARRQALIDYGVFAARYVHGFEEKWLLPSERGDPLGTADISAFTDLQSVYANIRSFRPFPFDLVSFGTVALGALLPMLPLFATIVPLRDAFVQTLRSFL
jgi:hypothetical protein